MQIETEIVKLILQKRLTKTEPHAANIEHYLRIFYDLTTLCEQIKITKISNCK